MLQKFTKVVMSGALIFSFQSLSFADERAMLEEISYLKSVISNLDERVKRLEKDKSNRSSLSESSTSHETLSSNTYGWKDKNAWSQIKIDMPEIKVESILGHPIRIDEMGKGFRKFFYHGEVIGSGVVSGNIEIYENRVYAIHPPEFQ